MPRGQADNNSKCERAFFHRLQLGLPLVRNLTVEGIRAKFWSSKQSRKEMTHFIKNNFESFARECRANHGIDPPSALKRPDYIFRYGIKDKIEAYVAFIQCLDHGMKEPEFVDKERTFVLENHLCCSYKKFIVNPQIKTQRSRFVSQSSTDVMSSEASLRSSGPTASNSDSIFNASYLQSEADETDFSYTQEGVPSSLLSSILFDSDQFNGYADY